MSPAVTKALRDIADAHNGRLTPELVVEAAKSKTSPLHEHFTWDVKKAASERWIEQARSLIRSVKVEVSTTQFTVKAPAYIRDPVAAGDVQGYVSLARLRTDEDVARDAVISEFARASAALSRAKAVALALNIEHEIEDLRGRVAELTERVQHATA